MYNFTCPICNESTEHKYSSVFTHVCKNRQCKFVICKVDEESTNGYLFYSKYDLVICPRQDSYRIYIHDHHGVHTEINIPFLECWPPTEEYIDSLLLFT